MKNLRMTQEQLDEYRSKDWLNPKAPKVDIKPRTIKKLDMMAPVFSEPTATRSEAEWKLENAIKRAKLEGWVSEYRFDPERRYRSDFAFPEHKLLIEVEGGIWSGGRHVRGKGYENDCKKYNHAAMLGFKVLRFTPDMIEDDYAIDAIIKVLLQTKKI